MTDNTTPERMREAVCLHGRVDYVVEIGLWVCADCLAKLDSRPTRYGPNPALSLGCEGRVPLQVIVWHAEIAMADGLRFADFLRAMARRYMMRTRPQMTRANAYDAAIDCLKNLAPDRYGSPAYGWDRGCAWDFADEDMQEWEKADGN